MEHWKCPLGLREILENTPRIVAVSRTEPEPKPATEAACWEHSPVGLIYAEERTQGTTDIFGSKPARSLRTRAGDFGFRRPR